MSAVGFGMGDVVLADCLHTTANTIPSDTTLILCTVDATLSDYARSLSNPLRNHFPVSFIGTVSEKN